MERLKQHNGLLPELPGIPSLFSHQSALTDVESHSLPELLSPILSSSSGRCSSPRLLHLHWRCCLPFRQRKPALERVQHLDSGISKSPASANRFCFHKIRSAYWFSISLCGRSNMEENRHPSRTAGEGVCNNGSTGTEKRNREGANGELQRSQIGSVFPPYGSHVRPSRRLKMQYLEEVYQRLRGWFLLADFL